MSITSCTEQDLFGYRDFTATIGEGNTGRRTFLIVTNDVTTTETYIISNGGSASPNALPSPLSQFPGSAAAWLWKTNVVREQNSTYNWIATCEYKSIFNQAELDRAAFTSPLDRPARITGTSRTLMVPSRFCLRTDAYTAWNSSMGFTMRTAANSAGDPLDPPIDVAQTEWELHCEKNVESLPTWFAAGSGYSNGVNINNQSITIRNQNYTMVAGTAKLSNLWFSDRQQENDIDFITIGWNVTFRVPRQPINGESAVPGPWDTERLDEGMRTRYLIKQQNQPDQAGWKPVLDKLKNPVMTPVPFDGKGDAIKTPPAIITEDLFNKFCYRPFGPRVDYSVIPWS
jgi:hypothetical protein